MQTFSFIIPVKPGGAIKALDLLLQIDARLFPHEVLIAEGRQPSQQRNLAACNARGDILYFLDDDSLLTADCLVHCAAALKDLSVAVVGGPSLTPENDSWLQKLFGCALASPFGAGGIRNRYRATGLPRETTEKELILCNIAIRRDIFLETGGFDERLYPNEENELLDRISASGHKLMHIPGMAVQRSQRVSLKAFARQMFTYGRGRAQQTLLAGPRSLTSFIPLAFILYLALLPLLPSSLTWKLPLLLYVAFDAIATWVVLASSKKAFHAMLLIVFPLMHCCNGLGLLFGFIGGKPKSSTVGGVTVRRIVDFD